MLKAILAKSYLPLNEAINEIISTTKKSLKEQELTTCTLTGILFSSHDIYDSYDADKYKSALDMLLKADFSNDKCKSLNQMRNIVGGTMVETLIDNETTHDKDSFTLMTLVTDSEIDIHAGVIEDITNKNEIDKILGETKKELSSNKHRTKFGVEKICMIFPTQYCLDTSIGNPLIASLKEIMNRRCLIIGGVCSDYWGKFKKDRSELPPEDRLELPPAMEINYQFFNNKVLKNGMPYLIFSGKNLDFRTGYGCGFKPRNNKEIYWANVEQGEIVSIVNHDNMAQFFHDKLKNEKNFFHYAHPIILDYKGKNESYLDVLFNKNEVKFLGDIPKVNKIKLQIGSCTELQKGTDLSIESSKNISSDKKLSKSFAIGISCCTRHILFGNFLYNNEYVKLYEACNEIPTLVFYCFGEIGPKESNNLQSVCINGSSFITLVVGTVEKNDDARYKFDENLNEFAREFSPFLFSLLKNKDEKLTEKLYKKSTGNLNKDHLIDEFISVASGKYGKKTVEKYLKKLNIL